MECERNPSCLLCGPGQRELLDELSAADLKKGVVASAKKRLDEIRPRVLVLPGTSVGIG